MGYFVVAILLTFTFGLVSAADQQVVLLLLCLYSVMYVSVDESSLEKKLSNLFTFQTFSCKNNCNKASYIPNSYALGRMAFLF